MWKWLPRLPNSKNWTRTLVAPSPSPPWPTRRDTILRSDIHLTRVYHKALNDFRLLRAGKALNKIPVLQNEPKTPDLSSMNSTSSPKEISTEPKEVRP